MFLKFIENFLTIEECNRLIEMGNLTELNIMKSSLIIDGKLIKEDHEWMGNKRMGSYFMDDMLKDDFIKSISNKIIKLSNEINPYNGITYTHINKYSFNKYSPGDFLDWHSDKHEVLHGATITYVIQLNDDYGDGEIKYITDKVRKSVPKKTGSVFIFDSNIQHSVEKITDGNRYSLNVWPSNKVNKSLI